MHFLSPPYSAPSCLLTLSFFFALISRVICVSCQKVGTFPDAFATLVKPSEGKPEPIPSTRPGRRGPGAALLGESPAHSLPTSRQARPARGGLLVSTRPCPWLRPSAFGMKGSWPQTRRTGREPWMLSPQCRTPTPGFVSTWAACIPSWGACPRQRR